MPEIKQTPTASEPISNGATPHANGAESATLKERQTDATPPQRGRYAHIVGWGYHVPEKVITNQDLEQIVDTNDEWIRSRTGIAEREVAADPKETSATLASGAARKALEGAEVPTRSI